MASHLSERNCPVCGKPFRKRADTQTCSRECGMALREQQYAINGRPEPKRMSDEQAAARREQRLQQKREYYLANRDKIRAQQQVWGKANRRWVREKNQIWRLSTRSYRTDRERDRRHGLGAADDWARMWNEQAGCCYLCGRELTPDKTHLDHDHTCCPRSTSCRYCRRGLACSLCNVLIGDAHDDPELLRKIADNLERALKVARARIATKPKQGELL